MTIVEVKMYEDGASMTPEEVFYKLHPYESLCARRKAILESTYRGNKPPREEWEKLAADFRVFGMENAANNLMERYKKMKEEE